MGAEFPDCSKQRRRLRAPSGLADRLGIQLGAGAKQASAPLVVQGRTDSLPDENTMRECLGFLQASNGCVECVAHRIF